MAQQHETTVKFRGGEREVEFEYEGDGIIVWSFADEDVCFGKDTTKVEQQAVYDQLWTSLLDLWAPCEEDYFA